MSLAVAARYAHALVDIVRDPKSGLTAEEAAAQLTTFAQMLAGSLELRTALLSPAVAPARKRAAAGRLADAAGLHRLMKNFVFVLINHRRTPLFSQIRDSFQSQMDEWNGVMRAQVTAAADLNDVQRRELTAKLESITAKKVISSYTVDAALVGGVTVRMGSTIYDGSVRGQLEVLRRDLGAQ